MSNERSILERELAAVTVHPFTLDEFHDRRRRSQRNGRIGKALAALLLAVVALGGGLRATGSDGQDTVTADDTGGAAQLEDFVGTWVATDADGSGQRLQVEPADRDVVDVLLEDEASTLCAGAPATLTGTARLRQTDVFPGLYRLEVEAALVCVDERPSDPGTPAAERELLDSILHLAFVHDPVSDELSSEDLAWRREGAGPRSGDPAATPGRLVDALNAASTDAFLDLFAPDGAFDPRIGIQDSATFLNVQAVSERELVDAWMAISDVWGFEAELRTCAEQPKPLGPYTGSTDVFVVCEVATRWTTVSLEVTERWTFEQRGTRLVHWGVDTLDRDPADRREPLGAPGLDAWETWLQSTHPADAARWLAVGDEHPLYEFDGHTFRAWELVPYDPAHASEIRASIDEYLEE